MKNSSSVKNRNLKPFKKGKDPRRHKTGAASVERSAWTNLFLNRLAERLKPEDAAEILAAAYEARRSWAITEVHERLMGRVTQPVSGPPESDGKLIVEVVHIQGADIGGGNGGDGGNGRKGK